MVGESATDAVAGANVVATDTWVSMGTEDDGRDRRNGFRAYAVTSELMARLRRTRSCCTASRRTGGWRSRLR